MGQKYSTLPVAALSAPALQPETTSAPVPAITSAATREIPAVHRRAFIVLLPFPTSRLRRRTSSIPFRRRPPSAPPPTCRRTAAHPCRPLPASRRRRAPPRTKAAAPSAT